jgi:nitrite reductase (NADH) small subunit
MRRLVRALLIGRQSGLRARIRRRLGWLTWLDREKKRSEPDVAERVHPIPTTPPDGFVAVMDRAALREGELAEVMVGDVAVALANVDGEFFAVTNVCPHAGGPLGDGILEGHEVTCPLHGWAFDLRDGSCEVDPELVLEQYEVRLTDAAILVRMPVSVSV